MRANITAGNVARVCDSPLAQWAESGNSLLVFKNPVHVLFKESEVAADCVQAMATLAGSFTSSELTWRRCRCPAFKIFQRPIGRVKAIPVVSGTIPVGVRSADAAVSRGIGCLVAQGDRYFQISARDATVLLSSRRPCGFGIFAACRDTFCL